MVYRALAHFLKTLATDEVSHTPQLRVHYWCSWLLDVCLVSSHVLPQLHHPGSCGMPVKKHEKGWSTLTPKSGFLVSTV